MRRRVPRLNTLGVPVGARLDEVGEALGLTRERVLQIQRDALDRSRRKLVARLREAVAADLARDEPAPPAAITRR